MTNFTILSFSCRTNRKRQERKWIENERKKKCEYTCAASGGLLVCTAVILEGFFFLPSFPTGGLATSGSAQADII